ncbi:transposase [Pseudofrankia sp. BMG5.36]|nr:transposase [Pseudofrankia sp. BMG5.36]
MPRAVPGGRLTDWISIGVLASVVSRDDVDEAVNRAGRRQTRVRLLPAHVVVYFVLAMCLFFEDSYEEVMRKLVSSLKAFRSWDPKWRVPTTPAICQARERLGSEPLRLLFDRLALPQAGRGTKGAWLGGRRLMVIDGTQFDLPNSPDNAAEFGYAGGEADPGAFPKALVVGLVEAGTHAVVGAEIDSCRVGERALAAQLSHRLRPGMLLLADRNFYSFELWQQVRATGADLAWRLSASVRTPVVHVLDDGSFLTVLVNPKIQGKRRGRLTAAATAAARGEGVLPADDADDVLIARVVEYTVANRPGNGANEIFCLLASVLDPADVPAVEIAAAYHERWEEENTFDEIKTHMRGAGAVLRSKSPDLVRQELWALLLAHYAIRKIMTAAADEAGEDPDRLSFIRSLRVTRRQVTDQADFSP